ncbi:MAG: hypothetical protein M9911_15085 [Saprospiraceae bacterium]|nr:hypothetical protein [Saprospiraceae bacterium]
MYNKQGCGYYFSFVGISPEVSLEQRFCKSGGAVLRMTVFRKFEVSAS